MTNEIAVKPKISQPDGTLIVAYALILEKFKADYDAAVEKKPLEDGRQVKLSLIDLRDDKESDREGDVRLTYTFNEEVTQETIGRILKIDPTPDELSDLEIEHATLIPDENIKNNDKQGTSNEQKNAPEEYNGPGH